MSTRTSNGVHAAEPVSPGPNAFPTSPAPSPSGTSKSSRPSGSSSSKSRQRTIRENAKPRVDNSADGSCPIVAEDGSSQQGGDRRSSGEVETGERWKGRVSPDDGATDVSAPTSAPSPATAPQTPSEHGANGHGTNGSSAPAPSGSKSGRRHVRDTSANGMEKELSSENLGDVLQGSRADNDAESTTRRSQSGKGEADTAKKDGDSETICNWLAQLGLSQYATQFLAHHVTGSNLEELDKEALQLIGVQSWGHRCSILKSITRIKEGNAAPAEEESTGQGARGSGPGGRKRGGERDRSAGTGVGASAGGTPGGADSHDTLKNVYEQIENMKMHFEAQMEQLNRELLSTKAELNSVKGALAAQASSANGGSTGGKKHNSGGNSEGEGKNGAGVNRNGNKQQRRKDNGADGVGEGNGVYGAFNNAQQGMGGQVGNAQYMRPVAQAGMTYGQPVYANMMHPGQQYFYGGLGMGMGAGFEGYDASAGQYFIQPVMQQQQAMQGVPVGADGYGTFDSSGQMMPVQIAGNGMQSGPEVQAQDMGANGSNGASEGGDSSGGV